MFGLICMIGLLLLPGIWKGTFPQMFILGYLGMSRRYHHGPVDFPNFNVAVTLGSLLGVAIILLIGALCFKDVFKIIRRLMVSHHES
jgi:heme/copper-type cytochrome/quinol oxidase subunit 1